LKAGIEVKSNSKDSSDNSQLIEASGDGAFPKLLGPRYRETVLGGPPSGLVGSSVGVGVTWVAWKPAGNACMWLENGASGVVGD